MSTDQLLELVDRKQQVLGHLCELGRRQLELIGQDQIEELLEVLWSKQKLITALHEVQRALEPYRRQLPEQRNWQSPAEREQCAKRLAECESLLAEILQQERHSELQLSQRRDLAAARLDGAHGAEAARRAYQTSGGTPGGQLDLFCEE
jgi:hypothetical protein